ncbi:MAG: aminoacyltransferase [Syntrophomonadaceae bacterium]|nr:aminoacyltransferase [Syntrophomonadaceae bacterium]
MTEVKLIDPAQAEEYQKFVASHPKGHILQTLEWGQVKKSMGWTPLPIGLFDDGKIIGAMLILKKKIPIPLISKSIFYAPRGPVADIDDHNLLDQLFQGIRKIARQHGAIFLKIDPDVVHTAHDFRAYLLNRGFKKTVTAEGFEGVQPTFVFRMDITPDEDQLLAEMAPKTRYNIRLAERKGVTVREATGLDDLKSFYKILMETAERDNFLIRGYIYFEEMWESLVKKDKAKVFMADYEGRDISGTLAFILGDKVWYSYGASSNEYRNVMPNYLLQWTMIKWAKERGCTLYDFRGVSGDISEDNPLYGLYRFKKGFGAEFTEFIGEWDLVYSRLFYWMWNELLPIYYKAVRQLIRWRKG